MIDKAPIDKIEPAPLEIDQGGLRIEGKAAPLEFTQVVGGRVEPLYVYSRKKDSDPSDGKSYKPIYAPQPRKISNSLYMAKAVSRNFSQNNTKATIKSWNRYGEYMEYKTTFRKAGPLLIGSMFRVDKIDKKVRNGRKPSIADRLASIRAVSVGRFGLAKTLGIEYDPPKKDFIPPRRQVSGDIVG